MKHVAVLIAVVVCITNVWSQTLPFQDPHNSRDERAKDLIGRLTLEEKAALMCDVSEPVPRLGIHTFNWWSEALHGLANNDKVTVFPEPICMAASFDDAMVHEVFTAVSDEIRAIYHDAKRRGQKEQRFHGLSVWTPNINIFRDPRWGRGQETYGEDPYLTSRMGVSVITGLQGPTDAKYKKLLACAKHFAVHSGPEWSRHSLNINTVDPRDLYETYLPAFKASVQQAHVAEVMCAYQRLDDEPCCGNSRLLQRILRDEWGFSHLVVSDCGAISDFFTSHHASSDAVHAASKAVIAGTDVECGFGYAFTTLPDAVRRGLITEQEIDKHLMRVLAGRFDLGEMDDDTLVSWSSIPISVVTSDAHKQLALHAARRSMTLLTNSHAVLPLPKSVKRIAVIGPNADDVPLMWGNYNGTPIHTITILEGIRSHVSADHIVYDKGCDLVENTVTESAFGECSIEGKKGMHVTYWNNREMTGAIAAAGQLADPFQLTTFGQHEFATGVHLEGFSGKCETVFRPAESGEIVFKIEACGRAELVVNGDTLSKIFMWRPTAKRAVYAVEKGKEYRVEILFRQVENWTASLNVNFGREVPVKYDALLEKLHGIDTVIFVGGISSRLEGEEMPVAYPGFKGGDRTDIELPDVQRQCLRALKDAGKQIIFVNCSGSAIGLVPETKSCDAILQAWYGGESGGKAVADVLFGDCNPSGKLPITFYKNIEQLPDFENYSMKGRTYRYMSDPLFPFGYGLSYTGFSISPARFDRTAITANESIVVTIPVTNTGARDGAEVVQVYVRRVHDDEGQLKTLKGFQRIDVRAGQTKDAVITLPYASFEFYDRVKGAMAVASGDYDVLYGTSSDAKDLQSMTITIR